MAYVGNPDPNVILPGSNIRTQNLPRGSTEVTYWISAFKNYVDLIRNVATSNTWYWDHTLVQVWTNRDAGPPQHNRQNYRGVLSKSDFNKLKRWEEINKELFTVQLESLLSGRTP